MFLMKVTKDIPMDIPKNFPKCSTFNVSVSLENKTMIHIMEHPLKSSSIKLLDCVQKIFMILNHLFWWIFLEENGYSLEYSSLFSAYEVNLLQMQNGNPSGTKGSCCPLFCNNLLLLFRWKQINDSWLKTFVRSRVHCKATMLLAAKLATRVLIFPLWALQRLRFFLRPFLFCIMSWFLGCLEPLRTHLKLNLGALFSLENKRKPGSLYFSFVRPSGDQRKTSVRNLTTLYTGVV